MHIHLGTVYLWGFQLFLIMLEIRNMKCPTIIYRPTCPSDLDALEKVHAALFPIRYERDFFLNVVNNRGIISWAAVAVNRSNDQNDELVGFVTTRTIAVKDSEIDDLIRFDVTMKEPSLVYILTLGVVEHYRNLGIASSLVQEVIKYASGITNCRGVYLHVIDYNHPAIHFYKKMHFKLVRRLPKFYYINGQHYDAYLFMYYVNGGQTPCSPLQIVATIASYFKGIFRTVSSKLWRNEQKKIARWSKCKESNSLLVTHNSRILSSDSNLCQEV